MMNQNRVEEAKNEKPVEQPVSPLAAAKYPQAPVQTKEEEATPAHLPEELTKSEMIFQKCENYINKIRKSQ